ncbi:hypothetical protein [Saccharopolyspora sp. 5N708]|uniref:hypothetical protein n=1 Tax=Saccharopolyspora sp. 5N708 TaxID=3457424 RepID=UPI003FD64F46
MNRFWVDPERLAQSGGGYSEAEKRLEILRQDVADIPSRYADSFGDDEEGLEFQRNFYQGHENFTDGVRLLGHQVGYVGDGVHQNGKAYGQANEDAEELSHQFRNGTETAAQPPGDTTGPAVGGFEAASTTREWNRPGWPDGAADRVPFDPPPALQPGGGVTPSVEPEVGPGSGVTPPVEPDR